LNFGVNALFPCGWTDSPSDTFFPRAGRRGDYTDIVLACKCPYVATMTFDVASVRENKNVDVNTGITMSGQFVPHTTMLRLINWRIESLISYAYGVDEYQIVGTPKWPWPTVFVIEAKGDSEADAKMAALTREQQRSEQQHMLQALLGGTFQAKDALGDEGRRRLQPRRGEGRAEAGRGGLDADVGGRVENLW
jgi:hypothetical protein